MGEKKDIAADPLRDREIGFYYNAESYTAKFSANKGWCILNSRGVLCPEKSHVQLWLHFKKSVQPDETKALEKFTSPDSEKSGQKAIRKVSLAELHRKALANMLSQEERVLLAGILKELALNNSFHLPLSVTSGNLAVAFSDRYDFDDF